jgi:hypothetical protein
LRYDGNALFELEEKLGTPIADLADIIVSAKTIRTLLWAGLIHADPEVTEHDVGGWIGGDGLPIGKAMEVVGEALADAFGGAEDRPTPPPTTAVTAALGTGASSGESH